MMRNVIHPITQQHYDYKIDNPSRIFNCKIPSLNYLWKDHYHSPKQIGITYKNININVIIFMNINR